jgi:hypothetical protein
MYVIIGCVIMGIVPQLGNITLLCFYSWNLSRATFEEGTEPLWDHFYVSNTSPLICRERCNNNKYMLVSKRVDYSLTKSHDIRASAHKCE